MKILGFIKKEPVLSAAILLAAVSSFFVPPDREYIEYIDFRTLALLLCLMLIVAMLQSAGVLRTLAQLLMKHVSAEAGVVFVLVMLCFFSSKLITNDVALITFVPFSFSVLSLMKSEDRLRLIVPVTVLQTVAANLGSMLTPPGNPQNLHLHGASGMSVGDFMLLMAPYTAASFLLLCPAILLCSKKGSSVAVQAEAAKISDKPRALLGAALFVLCLLCVARVIDWRLTLALVLAICAASDIKTFKRVDYTLLLTFIGFFIFIGNMERIPAFSSYIRGVIGGRECITAVLSSQIISNVPAALLLSGFTDNYRELIVGVNIGGLGTLIASMASLISFKYIAAEEKPLRGKYILSFTLYNLAFLAALIILYIIL